MPASFWFLSGSGFHDGNLGFASVFEGNSFFVEKRIVRGAMEV